MSPNDDRQISSLHVLQRLRLENYSLLTPGVEIKTFNVAGIFMIAILAARGASLDPGTEKIV